jgi:hypothetical protein
MPTRTQRDTIPPQSSAAFRRMVCDGRVVLARAIPTLTVLSRAGRPGVAPRPPRPRSR